MSPFAWIWSGQRTTRLMLLGDLLIVSGAMMSTQLVSGTIRLGSPKPFVWALLLGVVWIAIAQALNAYQPSLATDLQRGLPRITLLALLSMSVYYLIPFWSPPLPSTRMLVALNLGLLLSGLLAWRVGLAWLCRRSAERLRTLILGQGAAIEAVAELLRNGAQRNHQLVEVIDYQMPLEGAQSFAAGLLEAVQRQMIRKVIVDSAAHRSPVLQTALVELAGRRIPVVTAEEAYETLTGRVYLPLAPGTRFASLETEADLGAAVRRLADVGLAVAGLLVLAPVMVAAAVAIVLDSAGGPLYQQERVGRFGRRFQLLKLRTMVQHAEADGQALWSRDRDPRVTRVGAFLRRCRLDEAPQLWNVLRGEMSLVGPRPERPEFVTLLSSEIPPYPARHVVRPGITGWAQVNYRYGASVQDALVKLQYDLYHIRHRSLVLDALILVKTLSVVLRLKGI